MNTQFFCLEELRAYGDLSTIEKLEGSNRRDGRLRLAAAALAAGFRGVWERGSEGRGPGEYAAAEGVRSRWEGQGTPLRRPPGMYRS